MTTPRPGIGLHVIITEHFKGDGVRQAYNIVYEGIVAAEHAQPQNPQMVTLKPLDAEGPVVTIYHDKPASGEKVAKRTVDVVGWPVGMIALWSAYGRNHLRDVFTNEPMRWDGEMWWPLPGRREEGKPWPMGHDGKNYPPAEAEADVEQGPALTMGAVIWDGVVPR